MAPSKQAVKGKIRKSSGPFSAAIRGLRESLELTQEAAVRRLGVSLNTWRQWEYGVAQPRRAQLESIAALTDSPGLRMRFWLDIYLEGIKLGVPSQKPMTARETVMLRYINDSVMALRELCLSAAEGSTASEETLKHVADDLVRAAADAKTIREARSGKRDVRSR